jgi:molybdenum cofactor biosynthesis protein A
MLLQDSHQRNINYLRLSLLDVCNFRCSYCLPEIYSPFLDSKEWLTTNEIKIMVKILAEMGISKVRLTGGEPTLRKDFFEIAKTIKDISGIKKLNLTTNASWKSNEFSTQIHHYFDGVNISLDSLNKEKFNQITKTHHFETVWNNINFLHQLRTPIKLNVVVMKGINENELVDFVGLTKNYDIEVRFLETMPFDGKNDSQSDYFVSSKDILSSLIGHFGENFIALAHQISSTSKVYQIKNYAGKFGIIPAFSRTFCGECNRVRITAKGEWINCLYQSEGLNIKKMIRLGASKNELKSEILHYISHKPKDGFEAEKMNQTNNFATMSSIGG